MIDIHCHLLFGLDDGPSTFEDSLAMAESAISDGITHVVATPHLSNEYPFDYALLRQRRHELQQHVGDRLTLATGCDFHLSPENLEALRRDSSPFCINQHDYLLVEFNEFSIPPAMDQALHNLQLMGLRPIITHPERNGILRAHPERLKKWVSTGCFVQVTGGSLTGDFGEGSQKDALQWIGDGLVHFVASDAHRPNRRPLELSPAYNLVLQQFGEEKAQGLFKENPGAAFDGKPLPYVPDISEEHEIPRKKRFFFF